MKKQTLLLLVVATLFAACQSEVADPTSENIVEIVYNDNTAAVTLSKSVENYVTAVVDGAHVNISQSAAVSDTECGEIVYRLSGSSSNGSFYLSGQYKATLELLGLDLTNPDSAAINIQDGKRIKISAKSGTTNSLTDGSSGEQKGCLVCKGHTEFKGRGTLNIVGRAAHGVWSKEYVAVKNLTLNISSAKKDAIHCNQYFLMESGEVNLSGFGTDGVQVSLKTDDTSDENTGNFTQNDGSLSITMGTATGLAVKAEGDIFWNGGTHTIQ